MKDLRTYVSRRVIIETDTTIVEGVLARTTATTIELEHAAELKPGAAPEPIDGIVVVPSARVAVVQVL